MKNVKLLVALALMTGAMAVAQKDVRHSKKEGFHKDLSVEQLATLKTKKMTLALDLSEKQQQEIYELNVTDATFRKEKLAEREAKKEEGSYSKPTTEERYAMANAKLDRMIAQQQELKKILTDKQFDQWKKIQMNKHARVHQHKQRNSRRG